MEENKTTIELKPADSAFVMREDGSQEIYLKIQDDDEEISEAAYLISGLSIAFVHHHEALKEFVDQIFSKLEDEDESFHKLEQ